ncbi:zinc finger domain-containing protein [Kitasatospora kifunensis]|uniref:DNA-binding phage zinc finger domain-containing protein n=1 Tax=Kitasatospora kifunensis TaxID=58351 RepID=A0A7W7QYJ0_KITKI|nr:hypothetical protein [Kitasatospora kifunensis]MBB4922158.1 hypothetical protein [Kitasatospora kifunensis]
MTGQQTFSGKPARGAAEPLPTREQLLNLVNRTERHVLTPAETHQLRVGVVHLASQLGGAGAAIRRLTAERDAARRERDEAVRELALSGPQVVGCPFCGASAGERCTSVRGAEPPRQPHVARLDAAQRWVFRQALNEAS